MKNSTKFNLLLTARLVILLCCLFVGKALAQSDKSSVYTSNCTLSSGTNSTSCSVSISSKSYAGVKVGTSSNGGNMTITVPSGTKYLHLHISGWNGENPKVSISPSTNLNVSSISTTANSGISGSSPFTFSGDASGNSYYKVLTFKNTLTAQTTLTLSSTGSNKRFVVWGVNAEKVHTLTYSATNGSISGVLYGTSTAVATGASVAEGSKVTLTATPATGYAFTGWSVDGTGSALSSTSDNPTTFTMGTANATVTANFVVDATPTITVSSTSVAEDADAADGTITVTYNNITSVVAEVLCYEDDGTTPALLPSWLDVEIDKDDNVYYMVGENEVGTARSAYLKVHALDDEANDVFSPLITITQAALVLSAPTFDPVAGAVAANTPIAISQTKAASIRYTIDGTEPTKTTGSVYSTPITFTEATTIKAIAIKGDVVSGVATAEYTISVEKPTINLASSGYYMEGTDLTLTSTGNTIYYNMTINGDTPDDPTSSSTEYTGPIALSSGAVRIKAIAYDAYNHSSSVVSRTVNGVAPATLPFSWAGGVKADLIALTGVVGYGLGSGYGDTHGVYRVQFDGTGDYIEIFTDEKPVKVSVDVKMIGGGNTSKIKVQESTNGVEFADVQELTISGSQNDVVKLETSEGFASTTRVVKLLFDKGSNVGVGPIGITAAIETITLNAACTDGENIYGTYSSSNAFRVPAGLKVSEIEVEGGKLKLTDYEEHNVVPANTGVLVSSTTAGAKTVTISGESGTSVLGTDNLLKPSGDAGITAANMTVASTKFYRLTMHDGTKLGFWWGAASGAAFDLGAHKAYLAVPDAVAVKGFSLFSDDDTDAISQIEDGKLNIENAKIYNLAGQRLSRMQKGINIVNGKKILVK